MPSAVPAVSRHSPAKGQAESSEIIVEGVVDKPSAWKRAESAHLIVTSKGSVAELKRVTNNLERLYSLMSRLFHRTATSDDTVKMQITLIDTVNFFQTMGLKNLRSEEGPYAATFVGQRYYDPREDGEVLAVARTDQIIKLSTALAEDRDYADSMEAGGDGESAGGADSMITTANRPPVARPWEAVLYSAFAQHFLLTYLPAAYPRWYLDGVGALFSTAEFRRDGKIDYARAPERYRQIFRSYGDLNVGDVLTGRYLDAAPANLRWTPYHAWLLTHFFLFSRLKPERSKQFQQYMAAVQRGDPMAEASKVFGDPKRLQSELLAYAEKSTEFAHTDAPQAVDGDPLITALTQTNAAMIEERIVLGTRLAAPLQNVNDGISSSQRRASWIAQVRAKVAQLPYNADAILVEAEVECRGGEYAACLASAERVLAKSPDDVRALAWKGTALTYQALGLPAGDRAAALAAARKPIERAIKIDDDSPVVLIAYFRSFVAAGEKVPDSAMMGLVKVTREIPAAPVPRLYLAEELVRQGHADLARRVLYPVLFGAYDSPEKQAAKELLASVDTAQPSGQ
ncbi:hypothetical protein [Sphingomonas sp. GB1N7]|uniref:hypothetical protein n=1 Tax=Parasphingomonas caseinilytica TaxID=3096158 RepID=UPI002FC95A6E